MNFTSSDVPFTRIIEHKHFEFGSQPKTVISREYPIEWCIGTDPYYPINDERNIRLFAEYQKLAKSCPNLVFGGRLVQYRYYDMDKVIRAALDMAKV